MLCHRPVPVKLRFSKGEFYEFIAKNLIINVNDNRTDSLNPVIYLNVFNFWLQSVKIEKCMKPKVKPYDHIHTHAVSGSGMLNSGSMVQIAHDVRKS